MHPPRTGWREAAGGQVAGASVGSVATVSTTDAHSLVLAHLDRLGVTYEVVACDPALADTAAFCEAYGYAPEDSGNTIVVVGKAEPMRHVACVVLATARLDVNRVVRRRLGVRKASFAGPEETEALTGMTVGGVTPFGLPDHLPLWIDERVLTRARVVVGGGSRSAKVLCHPGELLKVPDAEVVAGLAG